MPELEVPDLAAAEILADLFWSGIDAVTPRRALPPALDQAELSGGTPIWLIAIGKAANQMCIAAVDHLRRHRMEPIGGIMIVPRAVPPPDPALAMAVGNHPIPGAQSFAASEALARVLAQVAPGDEVWVLLSGGASSLAAGPEGPIRPDELADVFRLLLDAGLDIRTMNTVRKRFLRWGGGRLAKAIDGARIRNFIISDVVGDDVGAIGSGPCVPDVVTAAQVRTILEDANLWDQLPYSVRYHLRLAERDPTLETPKPGHRAFARTERRIIASNRHALEAAAERARARGVEPRIIGTPLTGDAAAAGGRVALQLLAEWRRVTDKPRCLIWGGETTVILGPDSTGPGGRCQELALACARTLHEQQSGAPVALLAAGTDGRDGETDAAGAMVDAGTWARIIAAGRDPARDLAVHASYLSLNAAGALLRTDLTGTNVMDVVIGFCPAAASS